MKFWSFNLFSADQIFILNLSFCYSNDFFLGLLRRNLERDSSFAFYLEMIHLFMYSQHWFRENIGCFICLFADALSVFLFIGFWKYVRLYSSVISWILVSLGTFEKALIT